MKIFEVKVWCEGLMMWRAVTFAHDSMEAIQIVSQQRTFKGPATFRASHNPEALFRAK